MVFLDAEALLGVVFAAAEAAFLFAEGGEEGGFFDEGCGFFQAGLPAFLLLLEILEEEAFRGAFAEEGADGFEEVEAEGDSGLGKDGVGFGAEAVEDFRAADFGAWDASAVEVAEFLEVLAVLFDGHVAHFQPPREFADRQAAGEFEFLDGCHPLRFCEVFESRNEHPWRRCREAPVMQSGTFPTIRVR